jgi:hypothetical protein
VLGRRSGLPEATIVADRKKTRKTRDQLALLNQYASNAGLAAVQTGNYTSTIDALNGGAHGKAPAGQLKKWVKDTRALIRLVNAIGA